MEDKRNNQVSEPQQGDLTSVQSRAMIAGAKLVLASASPRRAEILRTVGWPFETLAVDIDESRRAGEEAVRYVQRVARAKAESAALRAPGATVLGADTVVLIENEILGKPLDEEDARRMLRLLRDRWHQVLTGVALVNGETGSSKVAHEVTEVRFAEMNEDEISWYVATGEPKDKAGAYAIQGQGARFIKEIRGDYSNVVGLPVRLLYELLGTGGALARP
jgi:septum formation protein